MHTIMHSELRNNSAAILRAVENGESYGVTNHGRLVAMPVPVEESSYDNLLRRGKIQQEVRARLLKSGASRWIGQPLSKLSCTASPSGRPSAQRSSNRPSQT